jgi:stage II sporulation protein D
VGMSQWGAHGLANRGQSYEQILHHYYRGAELRPYVSP